MLIFSACTEEKTGKSPEQITEIIDVEPEEEDTIPPDSITQEKPIFIPPPAPIDPVPPRPMPPGPEPTPWPIPEPLPNPMPQANPVIDFPDVEAKFPGGEDAMMTFISDNIKYPEIDRGLGNQGRVYVQFVVEKDGSLSNLEIMRGVSETIDREAKRVIRLMPKWTPGEIRGKAVRCKSLLPITFTLEEAAPRDLEQPLKVTPMIKD